MCLFLFSTTSKAELKKLEWTLQEMQEKGYNVSNIFLQKNNNFQEDAVELFRLKY